MSKKCNFHIFNLLIKINLIKLIITCRSKLDLSQFGKKSNIIELFAQIEQCLAENQRLLYPTCFFRQDLFVGTELQSLLQRLQDILKKHKGQIAATMEDADHVIYPPAYDEPNTQESRQQPWIRVIKKRGKESILVHRLFTPDSHDEWISNVDIDDDAAGLNDSSNNASGGDVWEVTANWLLDTDIYNEWMNQEDYEVDVDQTNSDGKVRMKKPAKMRKTLEDIKKSNVKSNRRSPSPTPPVNKKLKGAAGVGNQGGVGRKRKHDETKDKENGGVDSINDDLTKNMEAPPAQPHVEEINVPKSVNIKKESTDYQPYRNGTLIDLDEENNDINDVNSKKEAGLVNGNGHLVNGTSNGLTTTTTTQNGNPVEQQEACEQTHHIIVPSYAAWFDYTAIHEIEKRALSEFFNGKNKSKTPEIYMGYRNFMIDTYRLNPGEYLSATACRRNLPGDVCAIMRVHAFLEQWGLINYQVDYDARAAPLGPPCTSHFTILADTPSGLAPITGPRPTTGPTATKQMIDFSSAASKQSKQLSAAPPNKTGSTDDKESLLNAPSTPAVVDKLNADNFGLTKLTDGTTKKQPMNGILRSQEWTDQELLLLLEGLEMYKDDWNKVCEHVGTRTQDECILKFLQLPIEDPYLDPTSEKLLSGGGSLGPLAYQPIPFSQSGNPVMSTVAFLASIVDPRVASAAAKAAINEFTKMKDEVPPQIMDNHVNNVVQALKDGKKIDDNYNIEQTGIAIVKEPTQPKAIEPASTEKDKEASENEKKSEAEKSSKDETSMEVDSSTAETQNKAEGEKAESDSSNDENKVAVVGEAKAAEDSETKSTAAEPADKTVVLTTTTTTTTTLSTTTTTKTTATLTAKEPAKEIQSNSISELELKNAAASALAAAAVKARQLALNEEKKIKSTVSLLVETQLKKLEIKLRHFEELEAIMDRERENVNILFCFYIILNLLLYINNFLIFKLEHQRQQLLQERQQFHLEQLKAAEFRQRQVAAQQLLNENKLSIPQPTMIQQQQQQHQQLQPAQIPRSATPSSSALASSSSGPVPVMMVQQQPTQPHQQPQQQLPRPASQPSHEINSND